jgi:tetratricopeptide (TPR) repeat protein
MFAKQFELLERAVCRIAAQLKSADADQKRYLAEELVALRNACDTFLEKWIDFEEQVSELMELYQLHEFEDVDPKSVPTLASSKMEPFLPQAQPVSGSPAVSNRNVPQSKPITIDLKPNELLTSSLQLRNFQRGVGFFNLLMFPEAIAEFERVLEISGQPFVLARLYLGISCLMQNRFADAKQQFKLLEHMSDDPFILSTVYHARGILEFHEGDLEGAIRFFSKAQQLIPDLKDLDYNLGVCHAKTGKYVQALQSFMKCYKSDPQDWEAGLLTAKFWRLLGDPEEALVYVNELGRTFSSHPEILALRADLMLELNNLEHAEESYRKLVQENPKFGRGYSGLGWIALLRGDFGTARGYFLKHLSMEPESMEATFHYAWLLAHQGELEKAEQLLLFLLKKQPGDTHALIGLADVYVRIGQYPSARDLLHRVAKQQNPHIKRIALVHLGKLSLENKRYEESLRYFNAALRFDNRSAEALFYKGLTYYLMGDHTSAEALWHRCGECLPELLAQ